MEKPLNLFRDIPDSRDYRFSTSVTQKDMFEIPNSIDWTADMSPVKDQGSLGSCVGFAVAAMKEFQEKKEHIKEVTEGKRYRRPSDKWDLSEAWIYWNAKKIDPWPNEEGTSIRCAMDVLRKIGVPCERGYRYNSLYEGAPEKWAKLVAKWGLIDSYWRVNDCNELKGALVNGPVVIGIACFNEIFYTGSNGVVSMPANPSAVLGGHAICVTGYNEVSRLVSFKNSWGPNWGKKGYGFLHYEYVDRYMWDGWVAKDLSVTRKIIKERGKDELI